MALFNWGARLYVSGLISPVNLTLIEISLLDSITVHWLRFLEQLTVYIVVVETYVKMTTSEVWLNVHLKIHPQRI